MEYQEIQPSLFDSAPSLGGRPRLEKRAFEIASRLKQRRQQLKLTCQSIADRLGVPEPRYRAWEKQLGPAVERQYLSALARVIEVDNEWLSHGTGSPPPSITPAEIPLPTKSTLTKEALTRLGTRAQKRREELRLQRREVGLRIGTATLNLANWERQLPTFHKGEKEDRWEQVLGVPVGWLRDEGLETPACTSSMTIQTLAPSQVPVNIAEEIRLAGVWLSRASFAQRTTVASKLSPREQRLAEIFAVRYGVDGEQSSILQAIGDRFSLTRERIRQMVATMSERSNRMNLPTPNIDLFEQSVKAMLPATVEVVDKQFKDLLGESLSVESVERFCREILGRSIVGLTQRPAEMAIGWSPTAIDPKTHEVDVIRAVRDAALRMIRSCGAAQVHFVAGAAGEALGKGVLPADVIQGCSMVDGFAWLAEKDGWFWLGEDHENRLISIAKKVLAVAEQRLDAEEILSAFVRSRRSHYEPNRSRPVLIEPPLHVVVEVLQRVKGIKSIQYDDFYLTSPIPVESVLSASEQAVYQLMKSSGNIVSRHTMNSNLVAGGILKFMALQVSLNSSPIYRRLDRGVFTFRGAVLNASALEYAKGTVGGELHKKLEAPSADENGFFAFRFELTEYMMIRRVIEAPSALARVIKEGDYVLDGFTEPVSFAHLPSGARRFKKLLAKLIKLGFKVGDSFRIQVNPKTFKMRVSAVQQEN